MVKIEDVFSMESAALIHRPVMVDHDLETHRKPVGEHRIKKGQKIG